MSRLPAEAERPLIPELLAPEYLRNQCHEMQAAAPYLGLGIQRGRLDPAVHERLLAHFRASVEEFRAEEPIDEIRTSASATIPSLLFEDQAFNLQLAAELKPLHEEWAGTPLELSYCYGIRCYQRKTFLYSHVDRPPHYVSSSICVDHALDSPWPLSIVDVDGAVRQINLEPGELVLYEGTRLAHGRPYPLDGDYYAGIFVHYYPAQGLEAAIERGQRRRR